MHKIMNYMQTSFAPKVNKIVKNPWIAAIQDAIMTALPLVFVGSLITIVSLVRNFIPAIPDMTMISNFSFGMFGLVVSFLIAYYVMEKKNNNKYKLIGGATSLVFFLMLLYPTLDKTGANMSFILARFGAQGMFTAIISGLFVGAVMNFAGKHSFFSEETAIPDFVVGWFDSLLPITFILVVGWTLTGLLHVDVFNVILWLFSPLSAIVQSYPGFVLSVFIPVFLYTFGISGWVVMPVIYPVYMQGLAQNVKEVAAGGTATHIATQETCYAFSSMGGIGTTLALAVIMLFFSHSAQLKAIGKAIIVPSVFNINEPLVFGAPVAFNPYLMVPMWINGLLVPTISYLVMTLHLVSVPSKTFLLWYIPYPITSYLATQDWRAIVVTLVIFAVTWVVFWPFFKAYDNSLLAQEKKAAA
ncbi:Permease IIC component [Oenococcus oeni]|uniref:Permease IIC component n=1 Tax=Oenococcus oeni TaxID=1247 RepID=A0AAQ2USH0_OENOE|nr:PTS transporter subunit EIIC [Oenococcus oeni]SYW03807.1 Permease IIC component [Oenococcus oeni]VDB98829.1 Permease IIC component [Oenococcus oeni]